MTIDTTNMCSHLQRKLFEKDGIYHSLWINILRKIIQRVNGDSNPSHERIKKSPTMLLIELFAEREGFEPPVPLGTVVFKTTVIDHSTISPVL